MGRLARYAAVCSIAALILAWPGSADGPQDHRMTTTLKIMPLGDSITYGFVDAGSYPNNSGYRGQLYTLLTGAGLAFDFVGRASSSDGTLPDPEHEGYLGAVAVSTDGYGLDALLAGALAANPPDVILLQIGTNDMTDVPVSGVPRSSAAAPGDLATLLTHIEALAPGILTLVSTIPPRTDVAQYGLNVAAYNAALPGVVARQRAAGQRVALVDAGGRLTVADIGADGIHPTLSGYARLGSYWYHAATPALVTAEVPARVALTLADTGERVTLTARSLP